MVFWGSLIASLVFMSLVFGLSQWLKRLDVVDAAWGVAFIVVSLVGFGLSSQVIGFNLASLVSVLVIVWGLRLFNHIFRRLRASSEDPRYSDIRNSWQSNPALNAYFKIFCLQAVLAWLIALPVLLVSWAGEQPVGWMALVGGLVWLGGLIIESVSDEQLKNFVSDQHHRGQLMRQGLWRYSRHPNYFGELSQWWGIFIIALTAPWGWLGFIGPLTLTFLILFVSGIPLNERRQAQKPGWKEYQRVTSLLIPLPPKK